MKYYCIVSVFVLFISCNSETGNAGHEITIEKEFFDDGTLKHEGWLLQGKREGKHVWYYNNGVVQIEAYYKEGIQSGRMNQYYETGKLKYQGDFVEGREMDTSVFFRQEGSIECYEIFDGSGIRLKRLFFSNEGKLTSESSYVKVHFDSEPVLNTWIDYSESGDTIKSSSSYYRVVKPQRNYAQGSFAEVEIEYSSFMEKNHRIIYGKMKDDYSFLESEVNVIELTTPRIKIPLNTSQEGKNTIRFIFEDYILLSDSIEESKQVFGLFEYNVRK